MSPFGENLRAAGSTLMAILSPLGFLVAARYADEHEEVSVSLLLCALLVGEGVAFSLMQKRRGGGKGTNLMMCKFAILTAVFARGEGSACMLIPPLLLRSSRHPSSLGLPQHDPGRQDAPPCPNEHHES